MSSRHRTVGSERSEAGSPAFIPKSCGPSLKRWQRAPESPPENCGAGKAKISPLPEPLGTSVANQPPTKLKSLELRPHLNATAEQGRTQAQTGVRRTGRCFSPLTK